LTEEPALVPLAAAVVVRDGDGRVLLVRHSYGKERWSLPGGEVDPGESPAEAAVREAREEAGVEVELDHLIGVYYLRSRKNGLRFMFAAHIVSGEPSAADADEIAEFGWFEPDALPGPTTPTMPWGVKDAVAGERGLYRDIDVRAQQR
jgi:8-oxo-dGTP pyrophosphatase MutT (NUDIX family)